MIEIKNSPIHGLGVFAVETIKSHTKVYDYCGVEMSWSEFTKRYGKYKHNSLNTYPMRRIWRVLVAKEEPYKSENIINFINEGEPNVILKNRALYTLRDINIGEELLLIYPKDYFRDWKQK